MLRIKNIKMELYEDEKLLLQKVCKILKVNAKDINRFEISKKGLDSRKKSNICYVYNVDVHIDQEYLYFDNKWIPTKRS